MARRAPPLPIALFARWGEGRGEGQQRVQTEFGAKSSEIKVTDAASTEFGFLCLSLVSARTIRMHQQINNLRVASQMPLLCWMQIDPSWQHRASGCPSP